MKRLATIRRQENKGMVASFSSSVTSEKLFVMSHPLVAYLNMQFHRERVKMIGKNIHNIVVFTKKSGYFLGIPRIFLGKLSPSFQGFLGIKKARIRSKIPRKAGYIFRRK